MAINKSRDYRGITITITRVDCANKRRTVGGYTNGTFVYWKASGVLVDEMKESPTSPNLLARMKYISLEADAGKNTGSSPDLIFKDGDSFPLDEWIKDQNVMKSGQNMIVEGYDHARYFPPQDLAGMKINGISCSLPADKDISINKKTDGSFTAEPDSIKVKTGKISIVSINEFVDPANNLNGIKIGLRFDPSLSDFYPILVSDCKLTDDSGKILPLGLWSKTDYGQELNFLAPKNGRAKLHIQGVYYSLPGEWKISFKR